VCCLIRRGVIKIKDWRFKARVPLAPSALQQGDWGVVGGLGQKQGKLVGYDAQNEATTPGGRCNDNLG